MNAALAIAVREELGYTDDSGPRCDQCEYYESDNPKIFDSHPSRCMLLSKTLGRFIVSPQGHCKQFKKMFFE